MTEEFSKPNDRVANVPEEGTPVEETPAKKAPRKLTPAVIAKRLRVSVDSVNDLARKATEAGIIVEWDENPFTDIIRIDSIRMEKEL